MDGTKNGIEQRTRTYLESNTKAQSTSMQPPVNPIPPSARPKKASSSEKEQRVLYTCQMILDGRADHEIKRFFKSQYGLKFRQVSRYIRLARERLAEAGHQDVAQMRAEFFQRYMRIYREAETPGAKIAALKAAGAIYGVDAPQKVAQTTSDGKDVSVRRQAVQGLTIEELRALTRVRDRMRQIANDNDGCRN